MKQTLSLLALIVASSGAQAYSYFWYHPANWGSPHTDLGSLGFSFESTTLPTGLQVSVTATGGSYGPTSTLPGLYVAVVDSSAYSMGRYDGNCALMNTLGNGPGDAWDSSRVGDLTFHFAQPVSTLGFSLGNMRPGSRLKINGVDQGEFLPKFSNLLTGEYSRQGYFIISGGEMNTVTLDINDDDAIVVDHMRFQTVPEPASFAALALGAVALIRRRR